MIGWHSVSVLGADQGDQGGPCRRLARDPPPRLRPDQAGHRQHAGARFLLRPGLYPRRHNLGVGQPDPGICLFGHDPKRHRDYTEANGWQATFLTQHDIDGLIDHFGGDAAFEQKLDAFFAAPSTLPDNAPPDIGGLAGQYAHGNEPDQHAAYLYAYCGAPAKTQAMVRRLPTEMYKAAPDGVIGNDDCGQMSAWFVLSALGFYPVDPVSALYVLGSP